MRWWLLLVLMPSVLLLAACDVGPDDLDPDSIPGLDDDDAADDDDASDDDDTPDPSPLGWIGSPCDSADDCDFADAVCLEAGDGFPGGTCTVGCDLYCDDRAGHPVTFCVDSGALPGGQDQVPDGACLTRCDFGYFPDSGCRPGYGCVAEGRHSEPSTVKYVCLPGVESELSDCYADLAARGVSFEPTIVADRSPDGHPELTCHVEDPLYITGGEVHGVELVYAIEETVSERVLAACDMAHALTTTVDEVLSWDVVALWHMGTYHCRTIANTSTLSRHGNGDAIDISGFGFADGTLWTLEDEWQHDTTVFTTDAAEWLWERSLEWHEDRLWNVILTPNANDAHDNHFHVDLTPGSHSRYFAPEHVYGVNPWSGE